MADFSTSTHLAKWIFSPKELYGLTVMHVDDDGSWSYIGNPAYTKDNAEQRSSLQPLTTDDERALRAFFEFKIQETCSAFSFPHKIQATALIFFKRFYLQWSVMDHHPKDIMLTCIYTACKAEENHVSAEELGKGISQNPELILDLEMLVLQDFIQANDKEIQTLKDMHEAAKETADKIMLTDAPLLFPPGQLALAALRRSNKDRGLFDFERFLGSLVSPQHPTSIASELTGSLNAIDLLLSNLHTPTKRYLKKHINKKLKSCRKPTKDEKKSKKRKHRSKDSKKDLQSS